MDYKPAYLWAKVIVAAGCQGVVMLKINGIAARVTGRGDWTACQHDGLCGAHNVNHGNECNHCQENKNTERKAGAKAMRLEADQRLSQGLS